MIELAFTLIFTPKDWGFGFGYPETDGPGIPAISVDIQFICLKFQIVLYKTWQWEPDDS